MREFADIVRKFERARREPFALATLVKIQGSSYRRPGARMLIDAHGATVGSLSGGCLEEEVVAKAREVIASGRPEWMEFDTRRRFGCSGSIEILIEPADPAFLAAMAHHIHSRLSATVATVFARDAAHVGTRLLVGSEATPPDALVQTIDPALQLLMIGGGPDSVALREFCATLGWQLIPMESAAELRPSYDQWTAAIVKTHNYGRDFAALRLLLPMGLRYVALLGPRHRRDRLLGDLLDLGIQDTANLFSPAGLDLGGESPEAIALAIVAEIHAVFAGATSQPLRLRRAPIHPPPEAPALIARYSILAHAALAEGQSDPAATEVKSRAASAEGQRPETSQPRPKARVTRPASAKP